LEKGLEILTSGVSIRKRERADGSSVWDLRVRRKRQSHCETFLTKTAATAAGLKIGSQIDQGIYVPKGAISTQLTLIDALETFIGKLPTDTERQKTYKGDRVSHYNQIKKFKFSKLPLAQIHKSHIREFRDKRLETVGVNTVLNNLNTISKIYSYAVAEWDIKATNPVKGLTRSLAKPAPRERRLEKGEEAIILSEARNKTSNPWFAPLVEFLLVTGMRLGEVSHISPNQVDLDNRLVFLDTTKTNYPRDVPLPKRAKEVLEKFQPHWGKDRVFGVTSNTASTLWLKFKTDLLNRGLLKKDLHLHDLRHEGISALFEMSNRHGEPLLTVAHISLITGHKDINTLVKVYANISPNVVVDAMKSAGY
jgi:integrase